MSDELIFGRECLCVNEVIAALWENMTRDEEFVRDVVEIESDL